MLIKIKNINAHFASVVVQKSQKYQDKKYSIPL
jgi:hypothetical protein